MAYIYGFYPVQNIELLFPVPYKEGFTDPENKNTNPSKLLI
jgi:hypothetical protein